MPAHPLTAVVRRFYETFGSGDVPGLLATMTRDVSFELPDLDEFPLEAVYRGHAGIRRFLVDRTPAVRYEQFAPRMFLEGPRVVVVLGSTQGTALATGRPFAYEWVQIFDFRRRRIQRFREHLDEKVLRAAFTARSRRGSRGAL